MSNNILSENIQFTKNKGHAIAGGIVEEGMSIAL